MFNHVQLVKSSSAAEQGATDIGYTETLDPIAHVMAKVDLQRQWSIDGTGQNRLIHQFIIRERTDLEISSAEFLIFKNKIFRVESIEEGNYKDRDVVVVDDEGDPVTVPDKTDDNPLWSF